MAVGYNQGLLACSNLVLPMQRVFWGLQQGWDHPGHLRPRYITQDLAYCAALVVQLSRSNLKNPDPSPTCPKLITRNIQSNAPKLKQDHKHVNSKTPRPPQGLYPTEARSRGRAPSRRVCGWLATAGPTFDERLPEFFFWRFLRHRKPFSKFREPSF